MNQPIFLTKDEEPIVALCTPRGSGALAVLRICGTNATRLVDHCAQLSSKKLLTDSPSHTIHHGHIIRDGQIIDEVLFFLMRSPKTFTGQDTVEISCHNNPFVIEQIIDTAIMHGARNAEPGEFTQRAFLNEKIDLIQAEAIHDIITAHTQAALRKSLEQLHGSFSHALHNIEAQLLTLLTTTEASFEFLDEEQRDLDFDTSIRSRITTLIDTIIQMKAQFNQQQRIKEGIRIAFIGSVNTGKSTLFNALLGKERAIVSEIKGTTRDTIEATVYKNGNFWSLIDTAGLRTTGNIIEQQGIDRSLREADLADIILLIHDQTQELSDQEKETYEKIITAHADKIIAITNKCDIIPFDKTIRDGLQPPQGKRAIPVSAQKRVGLDRIEQNIESHIQALFAALKSPYLLNTRHYTLLCELERKLKSIAESCTNTVQYELVAHHIKELLETIAQLTGKNVNEKMIHEIFSTFCVGK